MLRAIYLITVQENFWIVQNSESDLATSFFDRVLIDITHSLLLYLCWARKQLEYFYRLLRVVVKVLKCAKLVRCTRAVIIY